MFVGRPPDAERQSVAPTEQAEVVVVRVVLLHVDDHVLDLRHRVDALGQSIERTRVGAEQQPRRPGRRLRGPAPHGRATDERDARPDPEALKEAATRDHQRSLTGDAEYAIASVGCGLLLTGGVDRFFDDRFDVIVVDTKHCSDVNRPDLCSQVGLEIELRSQICAS